MIATFDVSQTCSGIRIRFCPVSIFGDRIEIGRAATWVGTVVKVYDGKSGRLNAILPIELFSDDAIVKIKSFVDTKVIQE